jgi:hypothetical protein
MLLCSATMMWAQGAPLKDRTKALYNTSEKGYHFFVRAGYVLGGTSPIPLTSEIRSIDSYQPGLHTSLEGNIQKVFNDQWGVMTGLRLETKGMDTRATVKNYGMDMWKEGNEMVGYFTGTVKTSLSCYYLTVPILATFNVSPRWTVKAGPYLSYAFHHEFSGTVFDGYMRVDDGKTNGTKPTGPTGQKVEITSENPATYDFSNDMRPFQWGMEVGADWRAFTHLNVYAHLDWGMNGAFKSDFDVISFSMYPIYATVGFAYAF